MISEQNRNLIDEDRAVALLGFTRAQLRLLCDQSGLAPVSASEDSEPRFFTYSELCRLCRFKVRLAT
jgi:hypothetical protein